MLEALFRGKTKIGNLWFEGAYVPESKIIIGYFEVGEYDTDRDMMNCKCVVRKVLPETVGQYTGLTDKNGVKIFEGDIFRFNDEIWSSYYTSCGTEYDSCDVENYGVVGFDKEFARFDFVQYKFDENSVEADLHENYNIEFAEFVSNLEIIGNIHDNPELLEARTE